MHKYRLPETVRSPKDCIKDVIKIFDGGNGTTGTPYSLAKVKWHNKTRIAIRWNITEREWDNPDKASGLIISVGEPNSRGYSTWFILPDEFLKTMLIANSEISNEVKKALEEIDSEK